MLDLRMLERSSSGEGLGFSQKLDLSYITKWGSHPFSEPASVAGTAKRTEDGYLLFYKVEYTSERACDRCLAKAKQSMSKEFSYTLREAGDDWTSGTNEGLIPISNDKLKLTELVGSDLLLSMEESFLCKPDCLGLCAVCGADKNITPCDCQPVKLEDPRFDVLRELLGR